MEGGADTWADGAHHRSPSSSLNPVRVRSLKKALVVVPCPALPPSHTLVSLAAMASASSSLNGHQRNSWGCRPQSCSQWWLEWAQKFSSSANEPHAAPHPSPKKQHLPGSNAASLPPSPSPPSPSPSPLLDSSSCASSRAAIEEEEGREEVSGSSVTEPLLLPSLPLLLPLLTLLLVAFGGSLRTSSLVVHQVNSQSRSQASCLVVTQSKRWWHHVSVEDGAMFEVYLSRQSKD